jgi:hypothetical protein
MAHEVVLLGSWGFVYCVVHCCKVYALAHHLGIPIKRPKPNLPVYPRPMYVPSDRASTSYPQVFVASPRISLSQYRT